MLKSVCTNDNTIHCILVGMKSYVASLDHEELCKIGLEVFVRLIESAKKQPYNRVSIGEMRCSAFSSS